MTSFSLPEAPDLSAYAGRLAFITGGANGIGLALGQALGRHGLSVVLADIDGEAARDAAADLARTGTAAIGLTLDVRDPLAWRDSLEQAEQAFGGLAILCSNAGVAGSVRPLTETTAQGWAWTMEVNLTGAFNAIREGAPRLKATGLPAHFLATSSLAPFAPSAHNGVYAASKAGVISLCEALRLEMRGTPVSVSVLTPGLVRTSLLEHNDRLAPADADAGSHSAKVNAAMAQAVSAQDIAESTLVGIARRDFWLLPDPVSRDLIKGHATEILSTIRD